MGTVDTILSEFVDDDDNVYYDPEDDSYIPEGTYPANVIRVDKQSIVTRYNNKADIYKPVYRIDKSVDKFGGMEVYDKGIWRFKSSINSTKYKGGSGNKDYKDILEKFGIELETVEKNGRMLVKLPDLTFENTTVHPVVVNEWHESFKGRYGMKKVSVARIAHIMRSSKPLDDSKEVLNGE